MSSSTDPDWYDVLSDFNSINNRFLTDQYEHFREKYEEDDIDELREKYANTYQERRAGSQYKKEALKTVLGAFLNRPQSSGRVYENTGWEFWKLNPFEKKEGVTGDILLARPEKGKMIFVMLLPERQTPESVVEDSKDIISTAQNNLNAFDFTASSDEIHSAIVVNPLRDEDTSAAIETGANEMAGKIFVWRVYDKESEEGSEEKKILDHYADLDDNLTPTGLKLELLQTLEEGVEIQSERKILPDFFLSSHHSVFLEHIVGHIVQIREENDDGPLTHFAREEIEDYISDTLFGSDMSEESSHKTDVLLTRWDQMEVIRSVSSSRNDIDGEEFYRFVASANKSQEDIIETVTSNYQDRTVDFRIDIDAMEQALEVYRDEYGEQATLASEYN